MLLFPSCVIWNYAVGFCIVNDFAYQLPRKPHIQIFTAWLALFIYIIGLTLLLSISKCELRWICWRQRMKESAAEDGWHNCVLDWLHLEVVDCFILEFWKRIKLWLPMRLLERKTTPDLALKWDDGKFMEKGINIRTQRRFALATCEHWNTMCYNCFPRSGIYANIPHAIYTHVLEACLCPRF